MTPIENSRSLKVSYWVPDLTDPAVTRRRAMLEAGGASIRLIGFHRGPAPSGDAAVTALGPTFDAAFRQRMAAVARWAARPLRLRRMIGGADMVIARNLEMLLLARIALIGRAGPKLVYECLDIHRLMIGNGLAARALRMLEGRLMRRADRLIVSSPAFQRCYFDLHHRSGPPVLLVENRLLVLDGPPVRPDGPPLPPPRRPWRIGWFGMIRCRRSLQILAAAAGRSGGRLEVVIRGRPSPAVFPDLAAEAAQLEGVRFEGAYEPEALPRLYAEVDLVWAIDFHEAGLNSSWLLPNRLYEGGAFDRPIIALDGVETARWLSARGAGVILRAPDADLRAFIDGLDEPAYAAHVDAAQRVPRQDLLCDRPACRALVTALAGET